MASMRHFKTKTQKDIDSRKKMDLKVNSGHLFLFIVTVKSYSTGAILEKFYKRMSWSEQVKFADELESTNDDYVVFIQFDESEY